MLGRLYRAGGFVLLLFIVLFAVACGPDCRAACAHLVEDCGIVRSGSTTDECIAQCQDYLEHYDDDWQRDQSRDSVTCVAAATCDELQNGNPCYDESVFVW